MEEMANTRTYNFQGWTVEDIEKQSVYAPANISICLFTYTFATSLVSFFCKILRWTLHILPLHKRRCVTTSACSMVYFHSTDSVIIRPHTIQHCRDFLNAGKRDALSH